MLFRGQLGRPILVEHVIGDGLRITLQPEAPITHEGWYWLEAIPLARTVEGDTAQAGVQRTVLVLHHHDAVSPSIKGEIQRGREAASVASVRIVDEDAVSIT